MKTSLRFLSILLLGLMPFILWNCSDDKDGNEDEPTTNQNPIAGKWLEQGDPSCGVIY